MKLSKRSFAIILSVCALSALPATATEWAQPEGPYAWQFPAAAAVKFDHNLCTRDAAQYCFGFFVNSRFQSAPMICRANRDGTCPRDADECGKLDTTVTFLGEANVMGNPSGGGDGSGGGGSGSADGGFLDHPPGTR